MNLADPAPSPSLRWPAMKALTSMNGALGLLALALPSVTWAAAPEPTQPSEPTDVIEIVPNELAPADELDDEARDASDDAEAVDAEAVDDDADDDDAVDASDEDLDASEPEGPSEPTIAIRPPRVDGPYFGVLALGSFSFAKVLAFDTPNPLLGGGGFVQAGDAVLKWLSLGISVGGQTGVSGSKKLAAGGLLVEVAFIPSQRYPFSIRTGFGFGGGRVTDSTTGERPGFGGAMFKGSLRYEFFPLAAKRRPDRGGGWAIGPELGWLGATPAAKGQPFVHTVLLGISTSIYFGS